MRKNTASHQTVRHDSARQYREASRRPHPTVVRVLPTKSRPVLPASNRTADPTQRRIWIALQATLFLVGVVLVGLLLFWPAVGIALMWNFLIPIAPGLVTIAPGLWRNICPMATMHMLPYKLGLSRSLRMPEWGAVALGLTSVTLLF